MINIGSIIEYLNIEIIELKKIHKRITKDFDVFIKEIENDDVKYRLKIGYMIWAYFSKNHEEHIKYLKARHRDDTRVHWGRIGKEFYPKKEKYSTNAISFIDKIDLLIKTLGENIDIPLPELVIGDFNKDISILNAEDNIQSLFDELNFYVTRINRFIDVKKQVLGSQGNSSDLTDKWKHLITKNKLDEVLSEMVSFFQSVDDIENLKETVLLAQRYNKSREDMKKGLIPNEAYDLELRQITNALIDQIYSKKE